MSRWYIAHILLFVERTEGGSVKIKHKWPPGVEFVPPKEQYVYRKLRYGWPRWFIEEEWRRENQKEKK